MRLLLGMYLICMRPEQFHICHSINVLLQCSFSTKLLIIRYTHSSLISSSGQSSQKTKIYCLCKAALRAGTCRYFQRLLTTLKNPKVMKFLNLCLGSTIFKCYLNSLTKAPGATKNIQCLPREHLQLWPATWKTQLIKLMGSHQKSFDPFHYCWLTKGYFLLRRMLIMPSDVLKGTVRNLMEIYFLGCHWLKKK